MKLNVKLAGWMMDELGVDVSFNSISVISRQWKSEHERLCEAPFRFEKNLASSGMRTRHPVIRSRER